MDQPKTLEANQAMRKYGLAALALRSLFQNRAEALTLEDVLALCQADNLSLEQCKQRIESTSVIDAKVIITQPRQTMDKLLFQLITVATFSDVPRS